MTENLKPENWILKEKHIETEGEHQRETIIYKIKEEGKSKLWETLNSGFFLWVLSSIILASATQSYQWHTKNAELEQTIKKIDLEVETRLSQFLTSSEPLIKFVNDSSYMIVDDSCQKIFAQLWNELKTPPEKNKYISTVHLEYQQTSVVSLMALLSATLMELGHDVNEAKENGFSNWKDFETKDISAERDALKSSIEILMKHSILNCNPQIKIDVMEYFKYLFEMPSLKRWQWKYPYVDCNYKHPFC